MRKLIVLLFSLVLLSMPVITFAKAPNLDSLSIPEGLFNKQTYDQQKNQLINETIAQIHLYEKYFGKNRTPPSIKVVMSGNDIRNFDPTSPGVNGNAIYLVQTSDDLSSLGKFNTIFLQLIYFNFPNAGNDSANIIATFLKYKYFNANPAKVAALFRLNNTSEFLYDDFLNNKYEKPFDTTVLMLATAKLYQLDSENNPKLIPFMKKSLESGIKDACSVLGMDFPTFLRSVKLVLPNTKLLPIIQEVESLRTQLWSNVHITPNALDARSRLDASKDLDNALLFVSQSDETKPRILLDRVRSSIADLANVEKIWWIMFGIMLLLVTAGFLFVHNRMLLANVIQLKDAENVTYSSSILEPISTKKNNSYTETKAVKLGKPKKEVEPIEEKKPKSIKKSSDSSTSSQTKRAKKQAK